MVLPDVSERLLMKRISRSLAATGFAIALSVLTIFSMAGSGLARAQTPEASPAASPVSQIDLP